MTKWFRSGNAAFPCPGYMVKLHATSIRITHQTLAGEHRVFEADDWHATLLQHEYDHLDGILYPMRMTDLSLLGFNAEPGALAEEVKADPNIDPLLVKMVEAWPDRDKWLA